MASCSSSTAADCLDEEEQFRRDMDIVMAESSENVPPVVEPVLTDQSVIDQEPVETEPSDVAESSLTAEAGLASLGLDVENGMAQGSPVLISATPTTPIAEPSSSGDELDVILHKNANIMDKCFVEVRIGNAVGAECWRKYRQAVDSKFAKCEEEKRELQQKLEDSDKRLTEALAETARLKIANRRKDKDMRKILSGIRKDSKRVTAACQEAQERYFGANSVEDGGESDDSEEISENGADEDEDSEILNAEESAKSDKQKVADKTSKQGRMPRLRREASTQVKENELPTAVKPEQTCQRQARSEPVELCLPKKRPAWDQVHELDFTRTNRTYPHACVCGVKAVKKSDVMHHIKRYDPSSYVFNCITCERKFCRLTELRKHMKNAHETVLPRSMHGCRACGKIAQSWKEYIAHAKECPFKPANLNLSKRNEQGGFSSVKEEPTPGTSAAAGPIIRQSSTLNPQPSTSAVSAGPQRFSPRFLGQRKFTSKSGAPKKGKKSQWTVGKNQKHAPAKKGYIKRYQCICGAVFRTQDSFDYHVKFGASRGRGRPSKAQTGKLPSSASSNNQQKSVPVTLENLEKESDDELRPENADEETTDYKKEKTPCDSNELGIGGEENFDVIEKDVTGATGEITAEEIANTDVLAEVEQMQMMNPASGTSESECVKSQ